MHLKLINGKVSEDSNISFRADLMLNEPDQFIPSIFIKLFTKPTIADIPNDIVKNFCDANNLIWSTSERQYKNGTFEFTDISSNSYYTFHHKTGYLRRYSSPSRWSSFFDSTPLNPTTSEKKIFTWKKINGDIGKRTYRQKIFTMIYVFDDAIPIFNRLVGPYRLKRLIRFR